ncbi:MAG: hypothetical protein LQ343_005308 [Gyalolechia ehrenbergii]|nr:MAG: hypothetical protein LQ343_005308 [Gyalolechia ehrenbergii]
MKRQYEVWLRRLQSTLAVSSERLCAEMEVEGMLREVSSSRAYNPRSVCYECGNVLAQSTNGKELCEGQADQQLSASLQEMGAYFLAAVPFSSGIEQGENFSQAVVIVINMKKASSLGRVIGFKYANVLVLSVAFGRFYKSTLLSPALGIVKNEKYSCIVVCRSKHANEDIAESQAMGSTTIYFGLRLHQANRIALPLPRE